MIQSIAGMLGVILVGASLAMAHAGSAVAQDGSGFLKDYSQLQSRKDAKGVERMVWTSEKLTRQNYQKMMIDTVDFYPKAAPSDQVSLGTLNDIRSYIDSSLRKALGASVPLVTAPGPGVIRLRAAITAASIDKSLKPTQLVPMALIFTAATRATGSASYNVKLFVEAEMTDSVTGEVLARGVREAKGVEVKGDAPLTLKAAQPHIDNWSAVLQELAAARLGGQPAK